MNKKLFNVLMFATGAAIGSLVTWKVMKTKYERILQEEIDSVKKTWARLGEDADDENEVDEHDTTYDDEEPDDWDDGTIFNYHELAGKYNRSSEVDNGEEGGGDDDFPYINGPELITPKEFGNGDCKHSLYCINYYADGILADDWGVKLDIEDTIGTEALEHFGDHAEDTVHVRNDRLEADYEVVKDPRNYSDVHGSNPQAHMYAD